MATDYWSNLTPVEQEPPRSTPQPNPSADYWQNLTPVEQEPVQPAPSAPQQDYWQNLPPTPAPPTPPVKGSPLYQADLQVQSSVPAAATGNVGPTLSPGASPAGTPQPSSGMAIMQAAKLAPFITPIGAAVAYQAANLPKDIAAAKSAYDQLSNIPRVSAGVTSAATSVTPAAGGLLGFQAGLKVPVPGLWKVATGLVGMFAGQYLASKGQNAALKGALGNESYQALQTKITEDRKAYPYQSLVTETVPLLAVQGISPQNAKTAYQTAVKLKNLPKAEAVKFAQQNSEAIGNLLNVAFGAGTSVGMEGLNQIKEGKLDLGKLAAQAIIGAVLNKKTKFGAWIDGKFTPKVETPVPVVSTAPTEQQRLLMGAPAENMPTALGLDLLQRTAGEDIVPPARPISPSQLPPEFSQTMAQQAVTQRAGQIGSEIAEGGTRVYPQKAPGTAEEVMTGGPRLGGPLDITRTEPVTVAPPTPPTPKSVKGIPSATLPELKAGKPIDAIVSAKDSQIRPVVTPETMPKESVMPKTEVPTAKTKATDIPPSETPVPAPEPKPTTSTEVVKRNLAQPSIDPEVRRAMMEMDAFQGAPERRQRLVARAEAEQYIADRGGAVAVLDDILATGRTPEGDTGVYVVKQITSSREYAKMLKDGDPRALALANLYKQEGTAKGREFGARIDDMESPQDRLNVLNQEIADAGMVKQAAKQGSKEAIAFFIDDQLAKTDARLKEIKRQGRLGAGPDPEYLANLAYWGGLQLVKKGMQFKEWSAMMLKEFGDTIKPHLDALWVKARTHANELKPKAEQAAKAVDASKESQKIIESLNKAGYDITTITDDVLMDNDKFADILNMLSISKATPLDKVTEYWRNSILSGLKTHEVNTAANVAHAMYEGTIQRWVEAGLGAITGDKNAPTAQSIMAMYKALGPTFSEAKAKFIDAWRRETTSDFRSKLDIGRGPAIAGEKGKIIRMPQRFLVAADEFAKTIIKQTAVADYAMREANKAGLAGADAETFIRDQISNPDSVANKQAAQEAIRLTFQEEPGVIANALMQARNSNTIAGHVLKFLFPFIKTPAAIVRTAVRKSPLGILNFLDYKKYEGTEGKQKFYRNAAEQLIGLTALGAISAYTQRDQTGLPRVTGSRTYTGKPGEREFYRQHIPPQSIRIGNYWYSYSRLDPFASTLSLMVDMSNAGKVKQDEIGNMLIRSFTENIKNKTYLQTIGDVMEAFENGDRFTTKANRIAQSLAGGFVPAVIRDPLRSIDKYYRDNRLRKDDKSFVERWLKSTAGQAVPVSGLTPIEKFDIWGNPVERVAPVDNNLGNMAWRIMAPVAVQKANSMTNIDRLIWNWNRKQEDQKDEYWPQPVALKVKDQTGREVPLSGEQFAALQKARGQMVLKKLKSFSHLNFDNPQKGHIDSIRNVFEQTDDMIRARMAKGDISEFLGVQQQ